MTAYHHHQNHHHGNNHNNVDHNIGEDHIKFISSNFIGGSPSSNDRFMDNINSITNDTSYIDHQTSLFNSNSYSFLSLSKSQIKPELYQLTFDIQNDDQQLSSIDLNDEGIESDLTTISNENYDELKKKPIQIINGSNESMMKNSMVVFDPETGQNKILSTTPNISNIKNFKNQIPYNFNDDWMAFKSDPIESNENNPYQLTIQQRQQEQLQKQQPRRNHRKLPPTTTAIASLLNVRTGGVVTTTAATSTTATGNGLSICCCSIM